MEKRYYLNQSNSKYITIGICPASKLFNKDNCGFYVDIGIGGNNMKTMSLGGTDGFLNLCQSLRSFEELKFTYPGSAGDYKTIVHQLPINITKKPWRGSLCFHIETINGDYASIAQNTCADLLKFEKLVIASAKMLQSLVENVELKFHDLVNKAATDFSTVINAVEKSTDLNDLLSIEIVTNFNDIFKKCIDETTRFNATNAVAGPSSGVPKKRRAAMPSTATKRSKKTKIDDHTYAIESEEVVEIDPPPPADTDIDTGADTPVDTDIETVIDKAADTGTSVPLGMIEDGQRFESEHYI